MKFPWTKRIEDLEERIDSLDRATFELTHPPKFKVGDKVKINKEIWVMEPDFPSWVYVGDVNLYEEKFSRRWDVTVCKNNKVIGVYPEGLFLNH